MPRLPSFRARVPLARTRYLAALALLQFALLVQVVPRIASAFESHVALAPLRAGWHSAVQGMAIAISIGCISVTLVFPLLALSRHRRRGLARFAGLPPAGVAVAVGGGALFAAGLAAASLAAMLAGDARAALDTIAQSAIAAGTALMGVGAMCAELLRRGMRPRAPVACACVPKRIEVVHPPELRTHAA